MERYRYVHAARKVVGVGSVGTRAWIMLLLGRDGDDPLFLQFKEAQESVLEPFLGPSAYDNHGRRVVEGQRLMQSASDIMLGWVRTTGSTARARLLRPPALGREGLGAHRVDEPGALEIYARLCGWTLARAHARSGDPSRSRATSAAATLRLRAGEFAEAYADQNERDYAALQGAVTSGRVEVQTAI